jgi:protein gp37
MSSHSKIEWTDATWNPVRGCSKVSAGCAHCYAETFAERFRGVNGHPYEHGFDLRLVPEKLSDPLRWGTGRMVFVNSMSDLFQDGIPEWYIGSVVHVMELAPWHTFQVLTKRPARMLELSSGRWASRPSGHIWWGVSVENAKHGLPRIDLLRRAKVSLRFLSIEPLLEDLPDLDLSGIGWVIVGGESGPRARPMKPEWVERIRAKCEAVNVPFFFKQWGGTRKKQNGRLLNGRTYDQIPALRHTPPPDRRRRLQLIQEVERRFHCPDDELVQLIA